MVRNCTPPGAPDHEIASPQRATGSDSDSDNLNPCLRVSCLGASDPAIYGDWPRSDSVTDSAFTLWLMTPSPTAVCIAAGCWVHAAGPLGQVDVMRECDVMSSALADVTATPLLCRQYPRILRSRYPWRSLICTSTYIVHRSPLISLSTLSTFSIAFHHVRFTCCLHLCH